MEIIFVSFQISGSTPSLNDLFIIIHRGLKIDLEYFMAYAIITNCFVRVENFYYSFFFMFSAVYF